MYLIRQSVRVFVIAAMLLLAWFCSSVRPVYAQTATVWTYHNDNTRSGVNPNETILTPTSVSESTFGLVDTLPVNSQTRVQPLYVSGLIVGGQSHNVVYLASGDDELYAYDADSGVLLWGDYLGAHATAPPSTIGILSTPVIDIATSAIYVLTYNSVNGADIYHLHALDLATGVEKFGGPTLISATATGTGYAGEPVTNGTIQFNAAQQDNLAAMTLVNGTVYATFASQDDIDPWHGWVIGYDASTLAQVAVWNASPDSGGGGIWETGSGLVADSSNNIYAITGNANRSLENTASDYGESFVKLTPSLTISDYFKQNNYDYLNSIDWDLGAGGPILVPGPSGATYMVGGGKQGLLIVDNTSDMGGLDMAGDQVVQEFQAEDGLWGSPVFWNNNLYVWGIGGPAFDYAYNPSTGLFNTTPVSEGPDVMADKEPGELGLAVSSNGNTAGSAILWALAPTATGYAPTPGILHAYNASNLSDELWSSATNAARDGMGQFARMTPPTVAGGKVFADSWADKYYVYGLLPSAAPAAPSLTANADSNQVYLSWTVPATATSFVVYRSVGNNSSFAQMATVTGAESYVDTKTANGTTYYYQVAAANTVGAGALSSPVSAIPSASSGSSIVVTNVNGAPEQTSVFSATLKSNASGMPLAGKALVFSLNGIGIGTAITNSSGVASINYPTAEDYASPAPTIVAVFAGDGTNLPSAGYGTLNVTEIATTLTTSAVTAAAGQATTLSTTLKSPAGPLIAETVSFEIDGVTVGTAVTSAGVASLAYTVPSTEAAGSHTVTVVFAGDSHYAAATGSGTLTVTGPIATTLSAQAVSGAVGTTVDLLGTLTVTASSADIAGQTLTFAVNGVTEGTAVTNSSGLATFPYTVTSGTGAWSQWYGVSFPAGDGYLASSTTAALAATAIPTVLSVSASSSSATPSGSVTFTATLNSQTGDYALPNRGVNFFIDGVRFAVANTNSSGVATAAYSVPAGMAAGSHTVLITFSGDDHYSASSATSNETVVTSGTSSLLASPISGPVGASVLLAATLTASGAPIDAATVAFSVNGAAVGTAATNASGVATFPYVVTSGSGNWSQYYGASFSGNASFGSSTTSAALTATAIPTTVTVSVAPTTGASGASITITATLTSTVGGYLMPNRGLNFYVNGVRFAVSNTNANGVATATYTVPAAATGTQGVTASFFGDTHYSVSSGYGGFTVTAP